MEHKDYQKVDDLNSIQKMLRELMQELHCICEENHLIYNLFGGTLLGAVRHQDMIPWDDDIDITMPRGDFEKLVDIVEQKYADKFEVHTHSKENYIYPFGKFCKKDTILIEKSLCARFSESKLYIDIFPADGIPDISPKVLHKRYARAEHNKKWVCHCAAIIKSSAIWWKQPFTFAKYFRRAIASLFGYEYFLRKQIEETNKYAFEDCEYVGFVSSWGGGKKGIIRKKDFLDRVLYKFGKYAFWGCRDYHTWLFGWYGDYMTPPPEDKRVLAHNYDLYVSKKD